LSKHSCSFTAGVSPCSCRKFLPSFAHGGDVTLETKRVRQSIYNTATFNLTNASQKMLTSFQRIFRILFALTLLLSTTPNSFLYAQSVTLNEVSPPEGKTFLHITGIVQDKQGYMWFASKKGLYRYDGYTFITYKNDALKLNSLASNSLESLCIDSAGILWIGSFDNGLDRFDPITEQFTHFNHEANNDASLINDTVSSLLYDSRGVLWIGTPRGLDRFDPTTNKIIHYHHLPQDSGSLSSDVVRTIYEDRKGTIWIGTGSPYRGEGWGPEDGGLNRMNIKTGKFIRYQYDPNNPHSLINNKIGAIFEDSKGTFWIGTAGNGLHTMDRASGSFERHENDPAFPERLSRPPLNKNVTYDHISFIKEDAAGAIWIGTSDAGISRYDPVTGKIKRFGAISKSEWLNGTYDDNTSWTAFSSRDGIFWISTIVGKLLRIDPFSRSLPFDSLGKKVYSFYEERPGKLWIATEEGLIIRDSSNRDKPPSVYQNGFFTKILEDREGNIWVGTARGLYMTDKKKQNTYLHDDNDKRSISDNIVLSIFEDKQSNIWLGTAGGLDLLNRKSGTFTHYKIFPRDSSGDNVISSIFEDKEARLWTGSFYAGGIHQLNKMNGSFKTYLTGTDIRSIYQDFDGALWVAANDGLYRYDSSSDVFDRFIDPSSSRGIDNVRSLIEDNDMNMWIATDDGIIKLNRQRDETSLFGKNYKIDGSGLTVSAYKGLDGRLYFGSSTGYYVFDPRQLKSSSKAPQIILSDLRIADKLVRPGNNSPLTKPLFNVSDIRLPYFQNIFSIDFTAIDYTNSPDNRYLFMLENYDNTWRQGSSDRRASFYNVPPGKYVFKVKAANSDGPWAEKDLVIIITPPWWRTWWAYCIYGTCFLGIAFFVNRIIRNRIIEKERMKSREKELLQAKEIEKAYNELKATQQQLIQSEKMASLGELTAGIAHEIQNPLNFVNNFSEVNRELIEELKMKNEKLKINDDEVNELLDGIAANEEKINHHGKRADAIVKGMLQHSRSGSAIKEPSDINRLADEYVRLAYQGFRARDKSFNATFTTEFDNGLGDVNVVPQEIGRVILNLINNAFYAVNERAKEGVSGYEPTVIVGTRRLKDRIEISVKDNGYGIPGAIKEKIFQPFFTTKPTGQGTGLGLSLAYDILKAHGGELKVETKEGEGSKFIAQLQVTSTIAIIK